MFAAYKCAGLYLFFFLLLDDFMKVVLSISTYNCGHWELRSCANWPFYCFARLQRDKCCTLLCPHDSSKSEKCNTFHYVLGFCRHINFMQIDIRFWLKSKFQYLYHNIVEFGRPCFKFLTEIRFFIRSEPRSV